MDLKPSLIPEAKELEEDQQYEEENRLLYVALTRARKMLVLGEGFSRQTGPWLSWLEQVFEAVQPGAIQKARDGKSQTVKFKGFSVKVLPASQFNVPEQLAFRTGAILVGEPHIASAFYDASQDRRKGLLDSRPDGRRHCRGHPSRDRL